MTRRKGSSGDRRPDPGAGDRFAMDAAVPGPGVLYLCPTPVGNLDDITLRTIRVLSEADVVLAEDTRRTGLLLQHLGIRKPLLSYHDHNEHARTPGLVRELVDGRRMALVSDAGSPVLSDPGFLIVRGAIEAGVRVEALPGATALIPALTASGLPPHPFLYLGFLPRTRVRRQRLFASLASLEATLVAYEAPHRIRETLEDALQVLGARDACLAREISKMHETYHRGPIDRLLEELPDPPVGEMVLVMAGFGQTAHNSRPFESPKD